MIIFKICGWLLFILLVWHLLTKKYLNPYKLYMVVGKKGSGKTTMLVRLAYEHIRKGWTVYSTEAIPGTYLIDYNDIGKFNIPAGSLLLVDEVGMIWDARKYKEFPDHLRDWFKYQRHEGVKVYLFSQTFDVDKKIRDLTDNMYLVTNVLRVFAYAKRIIKVPDLVKPSSEGPARLDDVLKFDSILMFWCGSRMFTFIPRYAKLFDSHARLGLPDKEYPYVDDIKVPRSLMKRKRSKRRTKSKPLFCCVGDGQVRILTLLSPTYQAASSRQSEDQQNIVFAAFRLVWIQTDTHGHRFRQHLNTPPKMHHPRRR